MTKKVSNFTQLIQRVTASCLLHPPIHETREEEEEEEEYHGDSDSEGNNNDEDDDDYGLKLKEMEVLMEEVFEGVSRMKRAYVRLQEAHCPWDHEKMRVADVAVVADLKKLAVLRERYFRRRRGGGGGGGGGVRQQLRVREVVAPYEAVMDDLKKQLKAKDLQLQGLKDKLESVVTLSSCKCKRKCNGGENKAGRPHPNTKLAFTQGKGKKGGKKKKKCRSKSSFDGRSGLRH